MKICRLLYGPLKALYGPYTTFATVRTDRNMDYRDRYSEGVLDNQSKTNLAVSDINDDDQV